MRSEVKFLSNKAIKRKSFQKMGKNTKFGLIYLATNTLNGKLYVGKVELPKTIKQRWKEHLAEGRKLRKARNANPDKRFYARHLYNAIAKYGSRVWIVKEIDITYNSNELNQKEIFWIKEYDSFNPKKGYNMTEGGESGRMRPEVRKRISKSVKELWQQDEYRDNQNIAREKMFQSEEYREKLSKAQTIKWEDEDYKDNQSMKISQGMSKRWQDPEYQESQKECIQESLERRWQDPKYQELMQASSKSMCKDPEFREKQCKKISNAMNKLWDDKKFRKKHIKLLQKIHRKEITDVEEFLVDIKNVEYGKDLCEKYKMTLPTISTRIEEILEPYGVKNYTEAKNLLKFLDIKEILNKIRNRNKLYFYIN